MNVIVAVAIFFSAAFSLAWALSAKLRAWIEAPNYRFQRNAQSFDENLRRGPKQ